MYLILAIYIDVNFIINYIKYYYRIINISHIIIYLYYALIKIHTLYSQHCNNLNYSHEINALTFRY